MTCLSGPFLPLIPLRKKGCNQFPTHSTNSENKFPTKKIILQSIRLNGHCRAWLSRFQVCGTHRNTCYKSRLRATQFVPGCIHLLGRKDDGIKVEDRPKHNNKILLLSPCQVQSKFCFKELLAQMYQKAHLQSCWTLQGYTRQNECRKPFFFLLPKGGREKEKKKRRWVGACPGFEVTLYIPDKQRP